MKCVSFFESFYGLAFWRKSSLNQDPVNGLITVLDSVIRFLSCMPLTPCVKDICGASPCRLTCEGYCGYPPSQHTHLSQSVFYTIKIVWGISLPEYPNLFSSYLIVIAEYPWRDKILISSVASGEVELGEEGQGWEAVGLSVFWVLCGYRVNILPIRPFKKNNISKVRHDNRTS